MTKGGGEYLFNIMAKTLAENNHKVWVITNKIQGEEYKKYENIKLVFVPPTLQYKGGIPPSILDNLRYSYNAITKGKRIIKNEKIDIIHSNNFAPALAGSTLSYITSKKHITTIHDVFTLCGKNYWKMWGKQSDISKINVFIAPIFEKLMIRLKHDCIHTVSEATREDLEKFGATKPIHVIHDSVEIENSYDSVEPEPLQFVYVGRLVFYKNLKVILKAIKITKKIQPNIKLIIVGSGPHRKTLEVLSKKLGVESNVDFKGYVSVRKNIILFPSLWHLSFLVYVKDLE